jgi:hypothetical protein
MSTHPSTSPADPAVQLGPLVAKRLGRKFIDVDQVIEAEAHTSTLSCLATIARPHSAIASMRRSRCWPQATHGFWQSPHLSLGVDALWPDAGSSSVVQAARLA